MPDALIDLGAELRPQPVAVVVHDRRIDSGPRVAIHIETAAPSSASHMVPRSRREAHCGSKGDGISRRVV